jgi:hypothetical protein
MRYINNKNLKLPEEWAEKAETARQKVELISAIEERKKAITSQSAIWGLLKDALADLSKVDQWNSKCWYCEVMQERSDNAVDHFRPKNRVADTDPVHEGYWWLAFKESNFRYSCTFCNSQRKNPETDETGGKGDKFPLLPGSPRAKKPGEEDNESPILLDPCKAQDPILLDFRDNGQSCAKYPDHPIKKLRAEVSIKLYHLDHPGIVERRRIRAAQIKSFIKQANRIYEKSDAGNPDDDSSFNEIVCSLADFMSEKSELSAFSRKIIKGYGNIVWVEELFQVA